MNEYSWTIGAAAVASVIAENIKNDDQLAVLSAFFSQIGDSLATVLTIRALNASGLEEESIQ